MNSRLKRAGQGESRRRMSIRYGFGASAMNKRGGLFPLQDVEAGGFLSANQGGTTIISSLAYARDVFFKERES